jgi:hypothetical protein
VDGAVTSVLVTPGRGPPLGQVLLLPLQRAVWPAWRVVCCGCVSLPGRVLRHLHQQRLYPVFSVCVAGPITHRHHPTCSRWYRQGTTGGELLDSMAAAVRQLWSG